MSVKEASFSSTASSLTAPLVAAGAQSASAVAIIPNNPAQVIAADKAMQQLGVSGKAVSVGLALEPSVKTSLGDYPKWTYAFYTENPAASDSSGNTAVFNATMDTYGGENPNTSSTAPDAFGAVMMNTRILNEVYPNTTAAAVSAKMKASTGPGFLLPSTYHFGSSTADPALGDAADPLLHLQREQRLGRRDGGHVGHPVGSGGG